MGSSQICRSLLVSENAKVRAMPTLQIRADDVSCSHGVAVTDLNPDEVFYMAARGLSGSEARKLLLVAFPQDLVSDLNTVAPKGYNRITEKLTALAESSYQSAAQ